LIYIDDPKLRIAAFDKLCLELDIDDEEIDSLFTRDKDMGRTLDL